MLLQTMMSCMWLDLLTASWSTTLKVRKLAEERFLVAAGLLAATVAVLALGRAGTPARFMCCITCWVQS